VLRRGTVNTSKCHPPPLVRTRRFDSFFFLFGRRQLVSANDALFPAVPRLNCQKRKRRSSGGTRSGARGRHERTPSKHDTRTKFERSYCRCQFRKTRGRALLAPFTSGGIKLHTGARVRSFQREIALFLNASCLTRFLKVFPELYY